MQPAQRPAAQRRTRLYQLGALLVTAAAVAGVLIAALTSSSGPTLRPGKPVPGAAQTLALLAGIPQHGITLGSPAAAVTLVEFADLQCPACSQFATQSLPTIISRYVRTGRVLLSFRALDFIGADSRRAASMAAALGEQNALWQFVELAYRNQGLENSGYVTDTYLRALATAIPGVDVSRALAARTSAAVQAQLEGARALARQQHVAATPSFVIARVSPAASRLSSGVLDSGSLGEALEKALKG
jgi:protein-disulfide isomerase